MSDVWWQTPSQSHLVRFTSQHPPEVRHSFLRNTSDVDWRRDTPRVEPVELSHLGTTSVPPALDACAADSCCRPQGSPVQPQRLDFTKYIWYYYKKPATLIRTIPNRNWNFIQKHPTINAVNCSCLIFQQYFNAASSPDQLPDWLNDWLTIDHGGHAHVHTQTHTYLLAYLLYLSEWLDVHLCWSREYYVCAQCAKQMTPSEDWNKMESNAYMRFDCIDSTCLQHSALTSWLPTICKLFWIMFLLLHFML